MDERPKIGVLDSSGLWVVNGNRDAVHFFKHNSFDRYTLGVLFATAEIWELSQLWIHQSWAQLAGMWHPTAMENPFVNTATGWHVDPEPDVLSWFYRGYRPGLRGRYAILLPWLDDSRSHWKECGDGEELAHALQAYSHALGFDFRYSPGGTGIALLRSLHSESNHRQTQLDTPNLPSIVHVNMQHDARWLDLRMLSGGAEGARYIYAIDKNAMYVGAASSLALGSGEYKHLTFTPNPMPLLDMSKSDLMPGYYNLVNVPMAEGFYMRSEETLFDPDGFYMRHPAASLWVTAPTVQAAYEAGMPSMVAEMYYWPESHQFLTSWYKRIREARRELMEHANTGAGVIALQNLKRTYTHTIGWLDPHTWTPADGEQLYRPDWRHHIIAEAHARMWRQFVTAWKLGAETDSRIFAWDVDCFYIASSCDSGFEVAEQLGLRTGTGVGSFKIAGRYDMAEYREALAPAWTNDLRDRRRALSAMLDRMHGIGDDIAAAETGVLPSAS